MDTTWGVLSKLRGLRFSIVWRATVGAHRKLFRRGLMGGQVNIAVSFPRRLVQNMEPIKVYIADIDSRHWLQKTNEEGQTSFRRRRLGLPIVPITQKSPFLSIVSGFLGGLIPSTWSNYLPRSCFDQRFPAEMVGCCRCFDKFLQKKMQSEQIRGKNSSDLGSVKAHNRLDPI